MKDIGSHITALIVMIIWGLSYLSIKVVVMEMDPVLSAFYRFLIASIILFIVVKIKCPEERILKEDRIKIALGGIFGITLYFILENCAVQFTTASNVSILIATIPIFTLIAQRIMFKEKLTIQKLLGTLFSVIGITIIIASKEKISLFSKGTLGDLMTLGAALSWVMYNIINMKLKGKYSSITVTAYETIWGCLFLSPCLLFNPIQLPSLKVTLNLIYLSVFCSCIAFVLYLYCLKMLGPTVLTTYVNLQPIITLISAALLLKEKIIIYQYVGAVIIIIGVFLGSTKYKIKSLKIVKTPF